MEPRVPCLCLFVRGVRGLCSTCHVEAVRPKGKHLEPLTHPNGTNLAAGRAMRARTWAAAAALAAMAIGCAATVGQRGAEPLYLALEVRENGQAVAAPKLVGFEGHSIRAERRRTPDAVPDYSLAVEPTEAGAGYLVSLDLNLPSGHRSTRIGLLHGEERLVHLDATTELRVMLMRVESPEFRALMELGQRSRRGAI